MIEILEKILMIIPTAVISFGGVLSNTLSLTYFLRRENRHLGSRLLMLLNSLDLAVCIAGALSVIAIFWQWDYAIQVTIGTAFFSFLESTAFVTCFLSFARTLAVCRPYYPINGKAIAISTTCFLLYDAVVPTALYFAETFDSFGNRDAVYLHSSCIVSAIITVVVVCNVISIVKLRRCGGN